MSRLRGDDSIPRRSARFPSGIWAVRVRAVLPSAARDRIPLARKALTPVAPIASRLRPRAPTRSNPVSYNYCPRERWLTESGMLRIPAITEAIRWEHLQSLRFACAQLQPGRRTRVFVPGFGTHPALVRSVTSEGAFACEEAARAQPTTGFLAAKCPPAIAGLRLGREDPSTRRHCSPQRRPRNHCQVFPAYGK